MASSTSICSESSEHSQNQLTASYKAGVLRYEQDGIHASFVRSEEPMDETLCQMPIPAYWDSEPPDDVVIHDWFEQHHPAIHSRLLLLLQIRINVSKMQTKEKWIADYANYSIEVVQTSAATEKQLKRALMYQLGWYWQKLVGAGHGPERIPARGWIQGWSMGEKWPHDDQILPQMIAITTEFPDLVLKVKVYDSKDHEREYRVQAGIVE